jgi:predicted MFS family arabinose efflux permease
LNKNPAVPPLGLVLVARVFVPFGCGYFLSYLYRTVNAVIAPDLVADFGVDPAALGFLTSVYFLTFAAAQLPLGMLLDRFGPRRVNAALLAVASCGALVFSTSTSFAGLALGRGLIGLGVSGALMASLKAFTLWFPAGRLATVNGLLMAVGGLGALVASAPVEALLAHTDWRGVFRLLAGLTIAAAAALLAFVPRATAGGTHRESLSALLSGVATVFRDGVFWQIGLVCLTTQAGFMAVQGLWVAPWLADVLGMPRTVVAQYLLWMALAVTAGFAFFGDAADRFAHLGLDALRLFRIAAVATTAALAVIAAGWASGALVACMVYAFGSTGLALSYSILARRFHTGLSGRVNTAINMLVFVGAFALQWALGFVIGLWAPVGGRYPFQAYQVAFGLLVALQVVAALPVMRSGLAMANIRRTESSSG